MWIAQWAGMTEFWQDDLVLPPLLETLREVDGELPPSYRGVWGKMSVAPDTFT